MTTTIPVVWLIAAALPIVLVVAWAFGSVARWILRGLDADYATLKAPVADRFELWLRGLLTATVGQNAAAAVGIEFTTMTEAAGAPVVCRVTCPLSPRPVYLRSGNSAAPELWVRAGNSTRQLTVDEANIYMMHRWPLSLGATVAAQFRSAVRFSEQR